MSDKELETENIKLKQLLHYIYYNGLDSINDELQELFNDAVSDIDNNADYQDYLIL